MPDAPGTRVCRRAVIAGRVQGVWYRGWTIDEAIARGLDGWVRNRRDGTVEALFAGPENAVDEMIDACRSGPPNARVIDIAVQPADDPGPSGFYQAPTR